jgi:hypothetical protein
VKIDTLRKASLATLAWFGCFACISSKVIQVLDDQRRIAAIHAGRRPIYEYAASLPLWARITMYGVPSVIVGILIVLYRNRNKPPASPRSPN